MLPRFGVGQKKVYQVKEATNGQQTVTSLMVLLNKFRLIPDLGQINVLYNCFFSLAYCP